MSMGSDYLEDDSIANAGTDDGQEAKKLYWGCETFEGNKYGIRNKGGMVCWVYKPSKYDGQDARYASEIAEARAYVEAILSMLNQTTGTKG